MDGLQRYCLVMTLLLVGGQAIQRGSASLQASPSQVFGEANHPVASYRNQKGSYVLWQDGRITNMDGASRDLGHPYREPLVPDIHPTPHRLEQALEGGPEVAVAALVREDATYVLFADGRLRLPSDANAGAPAEQGTASSLGGWGWSGSDQSQEYQVSSSPSEARIQFSEAPASGSQGWGVGILVPPGPPGANGEQVYVYRRSPVQGNTLTLRPSATYIGAGSQFDHGFFVIDD